MVASSGCVPGVTWLPDSSGFLYVPYDEKSPGVLHYDLATKKIRTFVADNHQICQPAISPDGKHVALVKMSMGNRKMAGFRDTLQLLLFDRAGKEQSRSQVVEWKKMEPGED